MGPVEDPRAISKLEKPLQPIAKLTCTQCNERPSGFRGPHELARHIKRYHSEPLKKWICVDNSADQKMLAGCRNCLEGKTYYAYCTCIFGHPFSLHHAAFCGNYMTDCKQTMRQLTSDAIMRGQLVGVVEQALAAAIFLQWMSSRTDG